MRRVGLPEVLLWAGGRRARPAAGSRPAGDSGGTVSR